MVKIQIDISNRALYTYISLILIILLGIGAFAYNPITKTYDNLAPNPGHYATQIWVAVKTLAGGYDEMTVQDAVDTGRMATLIRNGNDLYHPDGNINVQGGITVNTAVTDASAPSTLVTKAYLNKCDEEEYLDGNGNCFNSSEIIKQSGGTLLLYCGGSGCVCPEGFNQILIGRTFTTRNSNIVSHSHRTYHSDYDPAINPAYFPVQTVENINDIYGCVPAP